jgi:NAD(P)-dependent dehydrogenase (short-subunit alcohol dehydrogenase family)
VSFVLPGKVAVVTGASSGIGAATARRLARAGMTVVAVARRADRLEQLATEQPGIVAHTADVTDTAAIDALAARVRAEHGACHVLVNNAGIPGPTFQDRDDLDAVLHTLDVNLLGTVRCMAAFAGLLEASAPSRIVNVASVAGKLGVGKAAYAASKFGVVGLSEATAFSWSQRGITVTQLNPGYVATEGFSQAALLRSPIGRRLVAQPEDVARAIHGVVVRGQTERTVPSWYRPFVVARHVAGPAFRLGASRVVASAGLRA